MSRDAETDPVAGTPVESDRASDRTSDPAWKLTLAAAVTVVSLVAFFLLVLYLLPRTGESELVWTRSVYLLTAVQAIAFAAVGWLFGREVHRNQAQVAEKRADEAQQHRDQADRERAEAEKSAAAERAKGGTFAATVYSILNGQTATEEPVEQSPTRRSTAPTTAGADLRGLAEVAARLYPESTQGRPLGDEPR